VQKLTPASKTYKITYKNLELLADTGLLSPSQCMNKYGMMVTEDPIEVQSE
jgi:hypothetical protein